MDVRKAILRRWNRRDVFAVLVIGVTIAFLTGTTLVVVAATTGTTDVARKFDSEGAVTDAASLDEARANAPDGAMILPLSRVTDSTGTERYVVGIPSDARDRVNETEIDLPLPDEGMRRGTATEPHDVRLTGPESTETVRVRPTSNTGALPPQWYIGAPAVVDRLGKTGALIIAPAESDRNRADRDRTGGMTDWSAIQGVFPFFVLGSRSIVGLLYAGGVGVGVLVGITVFSVSGMAVADRRRTIGIFRATGGTGRAVIATFAARAALLTGVGVLVGYAIGVIVPNAIVNGGIFVGVRASLTPQVTPLVARILGPVYAGTLVLGTAAGGLAARSTAQAPPVRLIRRSDEISNGDPGRSARLPSALAPTLFEWRALVPTTTTLIVFVAVVVIGWSAGATVAPAFGSGQTTITEPGAVHPIASTLPEGYATALDGAGVNASPEILAFTTLDDRPLLVRGANFEAFAAVSGATLVAGSPPSGGGEAVVGEDLARRRGLRPGETVALGGSTRPTVTQVTVVGVYAAPGPFDDQVLVSLPTARHLSGNRAGTVQFVRTDRVPDAGEDPAGLTAIDVQGPDRFVANRTVEVSATILNAGRSPVEERVTTRLKSATDAKRLSLAPLDRRTVTFTVRAPGPGNYTLEVLDDCQEVHVSASAGAGDEPSGASTGEPGSIQFETLPNRVPPNSTRRVRVLTAGSPAVNATIDVGDRRIPTDDDGIGAVQFGDTGPVSVVATVGNDTTRRRVTVSPNATRTLALDLDVTPSQPSSLTRATVILQTDNQWNRTLDRSVVVEVAGQTMARQLRVRPGEQNEVRLRLPRLTPGEYEVRTVLTNGTNGQPTATLRDTIRVQGNDRLVAALAARGREGGTTSIGTAIEAVVGNLTLVLAGIVALAGLMSVGSIAATFAGAVHGRRRTLGIRRATGAGPWRVLRMVLADALRIGVPGIVVATLLGFGVLAVADRMGMLTAFGIGIDPVVTPWLLATIVLGAGAVILVGATVATLGVLATEPARLVRDERTRPQRSEGGESRE